MATRRKAKSKNEIILFLNNYIFTSKGLPLLVAFALLSLLFVLIRMKSVEQDFRFNEVSSKIKVQEIENKELKAKRARMLSIKKLKTFSKKYNLQEPDEKHIIVVP